MKSPSLRGFTWVEVLVLLVVLLILASLALPNMGRNGLGRGRMTQTLSNMKQLHLATQQWTLDNLTTGENTVRWTCSDRTPLSLEQWKAGLVPEYISESDLKKLLSYTKERKFWFDQKIDDVVSVLAVSEADAPTTVLFVTRNWHGLATNDLSGEPYGKSGFIVFRKGGDGVILQQKKAADTNLIGSGGMHNYLPLK